MGFNVTTAKNEMCLYVLLRKDAYDTLLREKNKNKNKEQNMQFQNNFGKKY